jgi:hypothetical protein
MNIKSSLQDLSRREMTFEELGEYQRQIDHETNDRGGCLLMATNTELALEAALFSQLHTSGKMYGRLTGDSGPLNTFAQKIALGRALGIYGNDTLHNLDYIRLIRNAFAHSHAPINFETKEVSDAIGTFKQIPPLPPVGVAAYAGALPHPPTNRSMFRRTCDITGHNLLTWSYHHSIYRKPKEDRVERKPLA